MKIASSVGIASKKFGLKALEDAQRSDKSLRVKLAQVQSAEINRLESQQYEYEAMMTDRYAELEKDHQHLIAQHNEFLKRIAEFSIEMKNAIAFGLWDSETVPQAAPQEFKKAQKDKQADEKTWKHRQQLQLEVFNGRLLALEPSQEETANLLSETSTDLQSFKKLAWVMSNDEKERIQKKLEQLEKAPTQPK